MPLESYDMGPTALLPLRTKSPLRTFVMLKIHRPWPVLNTQTLGPMEE
jgi:hypothetical protein